MRIAHFLMGRCNPDSANGVEKTVYNLTSHLARLDNDVALFSLTAKPPIPIPGVEVITYPPARFPFLLPTRLLDDLRQWKPHIVHMHSVYSPWNVSLAAWLVRNRIPYAITPHGGLSPYVSRRRWYLKIPYKWLFERPCQNQAVFVHAVSQHEAGDIQGYGVRSPIEVIPNGFDTSQLPADLDRGLLRSRFPQTEGKRILAFLGRLDPNHKGLDLFLAGFAAIKAERPYAVLIGPDWQGGQHQMEAMVKTLEISDYVIFTGPVYGAEKYHLLSGADVFVHTSRWEGLPLAVLEACAIGLPCLVTPAADPNSKLADYRAGSVVEPRPADIALSMTHLLSLDQSELRAMGQRARQMKVQEFSWEAISQKLLEAYAIHASQH
jgi:glycosyltransferase involved in cell wall biosynthesis